MTPYAVMIDITDQIPGLHGRVQMSIWIFAPHHQAKGIIFCLDAKATFHLVVPGYPEGAYSVASFLAQQGWLVIAVDSLGMGESTHQEHETLTMEMRACANDAAFRQILTCILEDGFDFSLPRLAYPSVTMCIGHGTGAILAIAQQARYRRYDALAVLGWSNYQCSLGDYEAAFTGALDMENASREKIESETYAALRPFLYAGDVPFAVIAANEGHALDVLHALAHSRDYGRMQQLSALIDVPLFLCLAEKDVANNVQAEAALYPWSPHVETFVLRGSAYLHHVAETRHSLWTHLDTWLHQVRDQCVERKTETDAQ